MLLTQLGTWHSQERKTHIVAVFVGDVGGGGASLKPRRGEVGWK